MHPNALLEAADRTGAPRAALRASGRPASSPTSFASSARSARASATRWPRRLTRVLRQRLLFQHLAQSGNGAGEIERRLAMLAWQGNDGFLRAALSETRAQWLAQLSARSTATRLPEKLRHNLPEWLAEPLQAAPRRRVLAAGRRDRRSRRRSTCASTRFKAKRDEVQAAFARPASRPRRRRIRRSGLRIARQAGAAQARRLHARRLVEVQDEGSQLLALIDRRQARRDGGRLLRRRRRQDAGARRRRCATPGGCTRSTSRATGSRR